MRWRHCPQRIRKFSALINSGRREAHHPGPATPEGIFPYAQQAFLIERYVHDLGGAPTSALAAPGSTALSAEQASPERPADLVKAHGGIEALHHIRDIFRSFHKKSAHRRGQPEPGAEDSARRMVGAGSMVLF